MRKKTTEPLSENALDVKVLSEKLSALPPDKLMYVAGAITALAAVGAGPAQVVRDSA